MKNQEPNLEELMVEVAEQRRHRPEAVAKCYAVFNAVYGDKFSNHDEYLKASASYVLEELEAHSERS